MLTLETANGGGNVDIVLGVNGYIWIAKHVEPDDNVKDVSITRLEDSVSNSGRIVCAIVSIVFMRGPLILSHGRGGLDATAGEKPTD